MIENAFIRLKAIIMDYWIYIAIFAAAIAIFSMINVLLNRMSVSKKMFWFALVTLVPILGPLFYLWKRNDLSGE